MKKYLCFLLVALLLAGCASKTPEATPTVEETGTQPQTLPAEQKYTVGLSLPEQTGWQDDGDRLQRLLEQADCRVEVRFAENAVQTQAQHLEELIQLPVDCLVVAAVDSVALVEVLGRAKTAGIPVLAWDRLLMDTDGVSFCVSFDYGAMGAAMGQAVVRELALDTAAAEQRSYTVEFFMGSPDDHSALLLHKGLMEVLEPYLSAEVLICRSGRVSFEDSCILRGDPEGARTQCTQLLQSLYPQELSPDVVCTASNDLAHGCIQALTELGCTEDRWPLVTGQGSGTAGLRRVVSGKQGLTLWGDSDLLVREAAEAVMELLENRLPQSEHTLNNHVIEVPVRYCPVTEINPENYEELLIESGVYTREALTE